MLVIVGGPSGSGKSTVAQELADKLGVTFMEGDSLHPAENIHKMATGHPLTDEDRWGWLEQVATLGAYRASQSSEGMCISACSSLAKRYRDYLRKKAAPEPVAFVYINVDHDELVRRLETRKGHFMKVGMLQSQLDTQELPYDEPNVFIWHNQVDIDQCAQQITDLKTKLASKK